MEISSAAPKDANQILTLQKKAYQQEAKIYQDFSIPPLTQTQDEIKTEFDTHTFLIAIETDQIIGSVRAFCDKTTCFIGRLIVHPDHQGNGIGTKLMTTIESKFNHCKRFELFTGTKSDGNIRLYKRLGYVAFKEQVIHPGLSLIYLEK